MTALTLSPGLSAKPSAETAVPGRCAYSEHIVRTRQQTILVLCDTVTIHRREADVVVDFVQRSWGSKARITGTLTDNRLAVSAVAIAGRAPAEASGTCEFDYRSDATLSGARCLLETGSLWFAANFIASRL